MAEQKVCYISVRVPPKVKKMADKMAYQQDVSLNKLMKKLIEQAYSEGK
jgi:predicted HicB family RNase H-like nuclease